MLVLSGWFSFHVLIGAENKKQHIQAMTYHDGQAWTLLLINYFDSNRFKITGQNKKDIYRIPWNWLLRGQTRAKSYIILFRFELSFPIFFSKTRPPKITSEVWSMLNLKPVLQMWTNVGSIQTRSVILKNHSAGMKSALGTRVDVQKDQIQFEMTPTIMVSVSISTSVPKELTTALTL